MTEANGRFRIQVVSELTAVPAPTLRAWERRYGIPTPARTASAYRLYSDHDVAMVRRLRDLCANGMSIAEAARMVKASEDGAATLTADGDPYDVAVRRLLDAINAFDTRAVEREVARAQYLGSATTVFDRVFSPVMRRVGEMWHDGTLSVAQEHIATTAVGDTVRAMVRLTNPDNATHVLLLACFAEEDHVLPIHGVALRVASWGISTVTLGVRTPPQAIADAVRQLNPTGVCLSLSTPLEGDKARELVDGYARACAGTPWFVGGMGAPSIAELLAARGGVLVEGDIVSARVQLERSLREHVALREREDAVDDEDTAAVPLRESLPSV